MFKPAFIVLLFLSSFGIVSGQEAVVRSRFLADSLKVGETVPFSLTSVHPKSMNVLFPDSTYAGFAPFEFESKKYFPTVSTDSLSYDSAVYYVTSYEIDSIQSFKLPVFVLHGADCTAVYGAADTIFLKHLVAHVPDSVRTEELPLKTQTSYFRVSYLFNYGLLGVIVVIAGFGIIMGLLAFGRKIKKYFILRRLRKEHEKFLAAFQQAADLVAKDFSQSQAEQALLIWKKYMEDLLQRPFTKLSSREIVQLMKMENLRGLMQQVDRMVYGGVPTNTTHLSELRELAQQYYGKRKEEVKNG